MKTKCIPDGYEAHANEKVSGCPLPSSLQTSALFHVCLTSSMSINTLCDGGLTVHNVPTRLLNSKNAGYTSIKEAGLYINHLNVKRWKHLKRKLLGKTAHSVIFSLADFTPVIWGRSIKSINLKTTKSFARPISSLHHSWLGMSGRDLEGVALNKTRCMCLRYAEKDGLLSDHVHSSGGEETEWEMICLYNIKQIIQNTRFISKSKDFFCTIPFIFHGRIITG